MPGRMDVRFGRPNIVGRATVLRVVLIALTLGWAVTDSAACDPEAKCVQCEAHDRLTNACSDLSESRDCMERRSSCRACVAERAARAGVSYQCLYCVAGTRGERSAISQCVIACGGAGILEKALGAHVDRCE